MRLEIKIKGIKFELPISYQSIIQGFIYNTFSQTELGKFYHDQGYKYENKVFKMFTFSNLFGNFSIEKNKLYFEGPIRFYIGSKDEKFVKAIYDFLQMNDIIILNNQIVNIVKVKISDLDYFSGKKNINIKTISPVTIYQTVGKETSYLKPSSPRACDFILKNLKGKCNAFDIDEMQLFFEILEVKYEKERVVKFKDSYYVSYMTQLCINTNFFTLSLLYDTGISSKGSCGFGMIQVLT